jgi:hypothetical protein
LLLSAGRQTVILAPLEARKYSAFSRNIRFLTLLRGAKAIQKTTGADAAATPAVASLQRRDGQSLRVPSTRIESRTSTTPAI